MEGFRKLMSKAGSQSDKKSESSASSMGANMKLGRFRLQMRVLSNLGASRISQSSQKITYEPTYKIQPEVDKKLSTKNAEAVIAGVFEKYLQGKKYDPKVFPRLIKTLTELIRDRVKMQNLDRYKIIATVTIIENKEQGVQLASRALWNDNFDNFASLEYEGPNYFAVGSVYAVYFE